MDPFDIIIIGSGIGGLICANILAKEGFRVCVIEKNSQIGGCLQTYAREKEIFDAGVHYLGGLAEGQTLYQVFKYLEIVPKLKLLRMDEEAFDKILIEGDEKEYVFAQGYENFIRTLVKDFPAEEDNIRAYCRDIRETCAKFPLYNLRRGGTYQEKAEVLGTGIRDYLEFITQDQLLRTVLAGNNMLYAGQGDKTPFFVHALILNSFIESSWKCLNGGSQIARYLSSNIRSLGGKIIVRSEVKKIIEKDGLVSHVVLANGSEIPGKKFISNIHPSRTMDLTDSSLIRNAYRKRLKSLENSVSSFSVNIVLKKNSFPYSRSNYYYHRQGHVWDMTDYNQDNWPLGYGLFSTPSRSSPEFASAITLVTYMHFEEVYPWKDSFNTDSDQGTRGHEYEEFKRTKTEKLLQLVEERFPGFKNCIQAHFASTPLSYRDYLGTEDGSMYGIVKDYRDPVRSMIPAQTKLPNLFLTGQNLNLHGILGAAISGLVTCSQLLGDDAFIDKIRYA